MENKQESFRTSQRTGEASNGEGARARDSRLLRVITFLCQPLINEVLKGVEMDLKEIVAALRQGITDLNTTIGDFRSTVHTEADRQRELTSQLRVTIESLKKQGAADSDIADLEQIRTDLNTSISNLKSTANDVQQIVPPDVPDVPPADAPPAGGGQSSGEPAPEPAPEPSAGTAEPSPAAPPDGTPNPQP